MLIFIIRDTIKLTRQKNKTGYILKSYNKWYVYLIIFIFVRIFYNTTGIYRIEDFFESAKTPTSSMENTILTGDYLLIDKTSYGLKNFSIYKFLFQDKQPQREEVSVFKFTGLRDEEEPKENVNYLKRIIGLPGELIQIKNRTVYINGNAITEAFDIKYSREQSFNGSMADPRIFPKNSEWNEDNYGPLKIPRTGDTLKIDSSNIEQYLLFL